ncbi:MAG: cation transporter [Lachnospiraceae bacterium]|nr:cation transporter [Lachnospiraceae bacterium]
MITLFARLFIKNYRDKEKPEVRAAYGMLSGGVGIFLNMCLFLGKLFAGLISGSIAIMADAFNNLSDAGSSVITMLGFKIASAKPDREHPYGHGRMEYVSGMLVSILILLMAVELIQSSVKKILNPEPMTTSVVTIVILIVSILVKLYMMCYNHFLGKTLQSSAMQATAKDSLSDMVSTGVVLLCTLLYWLSGINLDAYCGILVGLFIFYTGVTALIDTVNPLLGQAPDPDFVKRIKEIIEREPDILGIHDLVVHDYGPGRVMVSLHVEVPASGDMLETHDMIDNVERTLEEELGCPATIHMDPIANDDERTQELRETVSNILQEIDSVITMHDFRIVPGQTHTNLIFDVVIPFQYDMSKEELIEQIQSELWKRNEQFYAVITVDRD